MTDEERQQLYIAIEKGAKNSEIILQKCTKKDLQFRLVKTEAIRTLGKGRNDVMVVTRSQLFEKAKELFSSSSDVTFLGALLLIKNLSNDNGVSLEVSSCTQSPDTNNTTNPDNYDGEDNVQSIYNKEVKPIFFSPTFKYYPTKPVSEVLSQFTLRDDWVEKKEMVLQKVSELLQIPIEELKKGGQNIRCISGLSGLRDQAIESFESFKNSSAGLTQYDEDGNLIKYPGKDIAALDKYLKFTTSGGEITYQLTMFSMFITGKSNILNATTNLDSTPQYIMTKSDEQTLSNYVEDLMDNQEGNDNQPEVVPIEENKRYHKVLLNTYGAIVMKGNKYIRPYEQGKQLAKGERVVQLKGEVFEF